MHSVTINVTTSIGRSSILEIDDSLIKQWEPKINRMISTYKINGIDRDDLAQELRICILKAAKKFRHSDQSKVGWMEDYMWEALFDHLGQYGALNKDINYKDAYTNKVLKEVYGR